MTNLMQKFSFNTFITILYVHMFGAIFCSSSGGQIVLIQHLVSSLSVSDRPVHRCTGWNSIQTPSKPAHQTVTYIEWHIPDVILIQLILLMMSTVVLETC